MPEDENLESLDTSTETATTDTDTGGEQRTAEAPVSDDWRVNKYGAEWESNLDYHKDTNKYLRGELDKAKRSNRRTIDEEAQPAAPKQPTNGKESPYSDVQNVDEFGNRIESRIQSMLSEREKDAAFKASLRHTREQEKGDPDNGIPSFADLEQEVLRPLIDKNPGILRVLKETFESDQLGPAANLLAVLVKFKTWENLKAVFAGQARQEMGDKINEVSREAVRMNNKRDNGKTSRLTPEQIQNMPKAEFEKLVARNTGRTGIG